MQAAESTPTPSAAISSAFPYGRNCEPYAQCCCIMSSVPCTINCWSVSKGRGERALLQPGKVLLVSMALLVRLGGRGSSARGFLPVKWVLWHGTSLVAQSRGMKRLTHKHVPACAGVAVTAATLLSQPPPPPDLLQGCTAPLVLLLLLSLGLSGLRRTVCWKSRGTAAKAAEPGTEHKDLLQGLGRKGAPKPWDCKPRNRL